MRRLAHARELLDGPLDHDLLLGNLRDLERANRLLGGLALSRRALVALATGFHRGPRADVPKWSRGSVRLLDVGTGGADIPAALLDWTAQRGLRLSIVGTDVRDEIIDAAFDRHGDRDDLFLRLAAPDGLDFEDREFDIAHCSLLLHHLEPTEVVALLREMRRVSRLGVVVNDLNRGVRHWAGAWLLSRITTRNRYTRNDAPLSVRRAYRPAEIAQLAARAGLIEVARFRGFLGHRYALAFVPVVSPAEAEEALARATGEVRRGFIRGRRTPLRSPGAEAPRSPAR